MAQSDTDKNSPLERLRDITTRLRSEDGCPWDRKQNPQSLAPLFLEESHEMVEALLHGQPADAREELGDILFHVFLFSQIYSEEGQFDLDDVARQVGDKLVRRHPHVFGATDEEGNAIDPEVALANWEKIKAAEKMKAAAPGERPKGVFSGVPDELPALLKAQRVQEKAAKIGFEWDSIEGPKEKIRQELEELLAELPDWQNEPPYEKEDQEGARARIEDELGDLLFSLVNYSRFLKISPEIALRRTIRKFQDRFQYIEDQAHTQNRPFGGDNPFSLQEMDRLWDEAKARSRNGEE